MLKSLIPALIVAAVSLSPTGRPTPEPKRIPVSSGSCVSMSADEPTGYRLTNACDECRTALVSWCDGDTHLIRVPPKGWTHVAACKGYQALLSDAPCDHAD